MAEAGLHLKLASLLTETGNYELSHDHFRAALAVHPSQSDILHNYACSLTRAQRYDEAASVAARAAALRPDDVRHVSNAGTVRIYAYRHDLQAVQHLYHGLQLFVTQLPVEDPDKCQEPHMVHAKNQNTMGEVVSAPSDNVKKREYRCGQMGGAHPCGQHKPLVFSDAEVRVAKLENKFIEGEGGLVYDDCQVYTLHHNHSENFGDHLIRMQRSKNEPHLHAMSLPSSIRLHKLHGLPVLSLIQHDLRNHYHWTIEGMSRLLFGLQYMKSKQIDDFQILVPWEAGINGVMRQSLEVALGEQLLNSCQFYHHAMLSSPQRIRYHVEELYLVHWNRPKAAGPHELDGWSIYHPPREGLKLVHNTVIKAVHKQQALVHEHTQVLYVSRALATFRKVGR